MLKLFFCVVVILVRAVSGGLQWETPNDALDQSLYEDVLDPELCDEQIRYITGDSTLNIRFADAGIRTPRGVLTGNTVDLGNYHQCLGITEVLEGSTLQGKYCMIRVPLNQNFEFPNLELPEWVEFNPNRLRLNNETKIRLEEYDALTKGLQLFTGNLDDRMMPDSPLSGMTFRLAVCIPKPCSTQQAITSLLFNLTDIGFEYQDDFCRLPNDKPWAPVDYVAVVILSIFGVLTLLSTCYDLHSTFVVKKDPKLFGKLFSVYTNGRRLMTFTSSPGTLECLDGFRAIAMMWVILGHCFTSEVFWANPWDTFQWTPSFGALWVTGGHITVDTFFTLSGILVVYTTAGKLTGMKLLKNIHLFYLNRLLRMFPILAVGVLFEASYLNHMTDGPVWSGIIGQVHRCRTFWWSTLLHMQNYLNRTQVCIGQSWYLAIDVQLHIISPLVLFWVVGRKKQTAWTGLAAGLLTILVASTVFNFIMEFPSGMMSVRTHEMMYYMHNYYMNTLTRGAPFFVGMCFGYLLHLKREDKVKMSEVQAILLWVFALTLSTFVMYTSYPILQLDWDNQTLDSLYNSFIRPIWALSLGIMIFACVQGYGGPINWFLSHRIWKLPARISYAMFILHYALMTAVNSTAMTPTYFTPGAVTFKFLAHFTFTFVISFLVTLIVDAPFSTIFKLMLSGETKNPQQRVPNQKHEPTTSKENGKL